MGNTIHHWTLRVSMSQKLGNHANSSEECEGRKEATDLFFSMSGEN
jgi:hypothetical protein